MPYTVDLLPNKKAILTAYFGAVIVEDIAGATSQALQFLNASPSKLYIVTDLSAVSSQPNRVVEIWQYARPLAQHKNFAGWLVAGTNNPIMGFVVQMLVKFGKIFYREFPSRAEAFVFLESQEII